MILYHHTMARNIESICASGLRAGTNEDDIPPGAGVVWLTTHTEPTWALSYYNGGQQLDTHFRLVVPNRDRRLVRWWPWARKNAPWTIHNIKTCSCPIDHIPSCRATYFYLGDLPRRYLRACVYDGAEQGGPETEDLVAKLTDMGVLAACASA